MVKDMKVILDIESRNHLMKDCNGDVSKLVLGVAGIKYLSQDKFLYYDETNINDLESVLINAGEIIGFNLVGHNGLDYRMLENCGVHVEELVPKTFDLMTAMIRSFGSYKDLSLQNLAEHTFGIKKKATRASNYRLIQSNQIERVKANLAHELTLIERLYLRVLRGGVVRFKTSWGLIDEHELAPFAGYLPGFGEEVIEPYDFPFAGMRLQIKEKSDDVVTCSNCHKSWRVKSVCYYGDTGPEKVYCPKCGNFLIEVRSSLLGEAVQIEKVDGHKLKNSDD